MLDVSDDQLNHRMALLSGELLTEKEQEDDAYCRRPCTRRWTSLLIWSKRHSLPLCTSAISFVAAVLLMLGIFVAIDRFQRGQPLRWESSVDRFRPGTTSCGATMEEAHARDCVFDDLSLLWIPRKCTQNFNKEYMTANGGQPFSYWMDRNGTEALQDLGSHVEPGKFFWTSRRNHIVHCQYNLYRLADALQTGEYVGHDDGQDLSEHLHHCVMTMTEFALMAPAHELDVTDVITEPGFGYC